MKNILIFQSFTFLAFILGASSSFLKLNYFTSHSSPKLHKLFHILWWVYSITSSVYFSFLSFDTVYADWDTEKRLVSNLAVSGVVFGEYLVRVLVHFIYLLKHNTIQKFVLYLYKNPFKKFGLQLKNGNHKFFHASYVIILLSSLFNIRMEWKANWEFYLVFK
jgi:hypothetical protein